MNAHARLGAALRRIASATSALRTRTADVQRLEDNGGTDPELAARVEAAVVRLEAVADELEATLTG